MDISFNSNNISMANPKVRRQKFGLFSLIIMVVVGAIFIVVGLAIFKSSKIDPSWQRITGNVVATSNSFSNGTTTYVPVVQYQVSGQNYRVTGSTGSSTYPALGSSRQVAYNPSNPAQSKVVSGAGSTLVVLITSVIGALLIIWAPIAYVRSLRRGRDISSLQQSGQKLQGIISDIQTTSMNNVNNNSGSNSYKIVVSAVDSSGAARSFVSDSLTGIGGLAMADFRTNPIPIDVYIDPANPQNYYVDVSEVPNLTPQRIQELIASAVHHNQPQPFVQPTAAAQPQSFAAPTPNPMPQPQVPQTYPLPPQPPTSNDQPPSAPPQ